MSEHTVTVLWTISLSVATGGGFLTGVVVGMHLAHWLGKGS